MPKMLDFQSFGEELWRIANVFRDDTLKTTEYLEEFSYFFFLKLWDERERAEEKELEELGAGPYVPYLPKGMRFYSWAEELVSTSPEQFCKQHNCESLVACRFRSESIRWSCQDRRCDRTCRPRR